MRPSLLFIIIFLAGITFSQQFKLGNEVLLQYKPDELKSHRLGLITNQTGRTQKEFFLDELVRLKCNVVKIFSPEHGIRGDESYSSIDEKTGIQIISLYGEQKKPSANDLSDVDVLIYDIQDVGSRFYTYTSTLYYCIQSAVENSKMIVICDRPIVIYPDYVDGFMLEQSLSSFVGKIPTPVCYGMTCGELAMFLKGETFGGSDLVKFSPMESYSHNTDFTSLNLTWVKPSPSMFYPSTALCYPATCFLEGTNVSEGRGTEKPFEYLGAPWVNSNQLADELNSYNLFGVKFEAFSFTPSEKISSYPPKFFNKQCFGVFINVTDKNKFEPVKCGVAILISLNKLFSEFKFNKDNFIDKLAGTDKLRKAIVSGKTLDEIVSIWSDDLNSFRQTREKYLLYR